MELAPFGKAAETGLRRRRAGRGKMPKFYFRSRQSESSSSRESFLGSAWVSPDRRADEMKLEVECYSGRIADERPVRFRLDGHEYLVEEVLDQWYGPQDTFYKVRADDGNLYILRRETVMPDGPWHLESFRQLPRQS